MTFTITDAGQNTSTAEDYRAALDSAATLIWDAASNGGNNSATITDATGATVATITLTHS